MIEIKCHDKEPRYLDSPIVWRDAEPATREDGSPGRPFRTCSYCGCIHPDDLIAAMNSGAGLSGSDWKYGWPHKFYVENIPNPDKTSMVRRTSGGNYKTEAEAIENGTPYLQPGKELRTKNKDGRWSFEIFEPIGANSDGKWYNQHLSDLSDEKFEFFSALLKAHTDIEFIRKDGRMAYKSPFKGYQK